MIKAYAHECYLHTRLTWPTGRGSSAVLVRQFVCGRIHVHAAEGGQTRVEEALLDRGELHAPQGRVVVAIARHIHR